MIEADATDWRNLLWWTGTIIALSPIWGTLAYELWAARIKPLLIPRQEIERIAAELFAQHGDRAAEVAAINEDRAWRDSDSFEQGKWRRVRCFLTTHAPS